MRRLLAAMVCTASVLLSSATVAQETDDVARAERLYNDGLAAFEASDFSTAATMFRASWALVPKPELLYNEAFAWGRAGELERAIAAASEARDAGLPDSMGVKNNARLQAWTLQRQATRIARDAPSVEPRAEAVARPEPTTTKTSDAPSSSAQRPLAIGLAVGGGAALVAATGVEFALAAVGRRMDSAAATGDRDAYEDALARGKKLQRAGRILLIAGPTLSAVGLVLWVWPRSSEAVAFTVAPRNIQLSVTW